MTSFNKFPWLKYSLGLLVCLLLRLIPFRPANLEPILTSQMPFAKAYGKIAGFLFACLSIIIYDFITGRVGVWTGVVAAAYGLLGIWAAYYLKNKKNSPLAYAKFALMGTLAFDAVTGLAFGPLFFGQSFMEALIGQIPFTARHLLGNLILALTVSPLLYRFVVDNKFLASKTLFNLLTRKPI